MGPHGASGSPVAFGRRRLRSLLVAECFMLRIIRGWHRSLRFSYFSKPELSSLCVQSTNTESINPQDVVCPGIITPVVYLPCTLLYALTPEISPVSQPRDSQCNDPRTRDHPPSYGSRDSRTAHELSSPSD